MAEVEGSPRLLELRGITKAFGGVHALSGVDFSLNAGTVHALVGENGAGKSTLMKILSGAYRPDAGQILLDGRTVRMDSPCAGRAHGIAMIYQELNLARDLTVEQNVVLGLEESRFGLVRPAKEKVSHALEELGHPDIPLDVQVGDLPIARQQVVEIARALITDARIIVMDEPTSSLSQADTQRLFEAIARLRASGISIIYISHFLEEVLEVCDSYTVVRDGRTVGSGSVAGTDMARIISLMVGRDLDDMFPSVEHVPREVMLEVDEASADPVPVDASFQVCAGEVLGIAGLVGSGRSETLRSVFGLDRASGGRLAKKGARPMAGQLRKMTARRALGNGIDLLSEDRKEEGLATDLTVSDNLTLSTLGRYTRPRNWGLFRRGSLERVADQWISRLGIRCRDSRQKVSALSGGNQQKVALARMLENDARVLLLDEPTRGVDVGSKVEIYRLMLEQAKAGKAIVFVSSYLPELFGVCDRIAVMHRGRLSPARKTSEWTPESVMAYATSGDAVRQ